MKLIKIQFTYTNITKPDGASLTELWCGIEEIIKSKCPDSVLTLSSGKLAFQCTIVTSLELEDIKKDLDEYITLQNKKGEVYSNITCLSDNDIQQFVDSNPELADDLRIKACFSDSDNSNNNQTQETTESEKKENEATNLDIFSQKCKRDDGKTQETGKAENTEKSVQFNKAEKAVDSENNTLAGVAKEMAKLKKHLLNKVNGQRHAIDAFVQGMFEAEAFASHNKERKGPQSLYLFVGSSGVGKTYLAEQAKEVLNRPYLRVDMSEFSDNLANMNFNGEHDSKNIVTGFVYKNPNGIILFDEIEKAHINTIYLFLQILDAGRLMDYRYNKEVSFSNTVIIITTNAGHTLFEDPTKFDLSGVPTSTILEALRTDLNPKDNSPYFPECITTRMANGYVILFNRLEPYALRTIVGTEISSQIAIFEQAYKVNIRYDAAMLAAVILYKGGGLTDARTLRGMARSFIAKELHDVTMLIMDSGKDIAALKTISFEIKPDTADEEVKSLFSVDKKLRVIVFCDENVEQVVASCVSQNIEAVFATDLADFKKKLRGVADFVLLDVCRGYTRSKVEPGDLEDIESDGIEAFSYVKDYYSEIPIQLLDCRRYDDSAYESLLAHGGRGLIRLSKNLKLFKKQMEELAFCSLVNNSTFRLTRTSKVLTYNCAQYVQNNIAKIRINRLKLKPAPASKDSGFLLNSGTDVMFSDISGCTEAKKSLSEFSTYLSNPREMAMKGKRMPKGVLLYGPPGTGKTLLAKAMANETKATFIPTTATAFFDPYVGVSERNVREMFARARRYAPSIVFIDEIDAIARQRTGASTTAHTESVLNAFIAEMDGFVVDEKRPVFILAATNYEIEGVGKRVLDKAFVRRFDRAIMVELPNEEERYDFLSKTLTKHGIMGFESAIQSLAARSAGMSCAELDMMIEFALRSVGDNELTSAILIDSLDAFLYGEEKDFNKNDLRQTACHESGHALLSWLGGEIPTFLTIVARGNFGGYMMHSASDKSTFNRQDLINTIRCALAGRAAEYVNYDEKGINTGVRSDIEHARAYLEAFYYDYAMGETLYARPTEDQFENALSAEYCNTVELIRANIDVLNALTDCLVKERAMDENRLKEFFAQFEPKYL